MRFHLLQHGLRDLHTHGLVEALGWRRALERRNLAHALYIHKDATTQVIEQSGGIPQFPHEPTSNIQRDPVSDALHGFLVFGGAFGRACEDLSDRVAAEDVVLIPQSTARELFGVAHWLSLLPAERRPRVVFVFINPAPDWVLSDDRKNVRGNIAFHRLGANLLADLTPPGHVLYYADNDILSQALGHALGQPCAAGPMTIDYFDADDVPGDAADPDWTPAHIGVIGQFRPEKGASEVPDVLRKFTMARPDRRLFVQTADDDQAAALRNAIGNPPAAEIDIFSGQLSQRGYIRRLTSIDILLLPYQRQRYAMRTSGIFAEAVAHGIVTVVPAGTWMAEMLAQGWGAGVSFEPHSADSIAGALGQASDRFAELKQAAGRRQAEWREQQSTPALLAQILAALENGATADA